MDHGDARRGKEGACMHGREDGRKEVTAWGDGGVAGVCSALLFFTCKMFP